MNADHPNDVRPILVFATHNPNKVRELQEMLGDQYQIQSLTDIGCHEEIVENALTLKGNAQIKARHVVEHYGLDCFADDTGLEVDALDGAPGVFSARYAGIHGDAEGNMTKLLAELERVGATAQEARAAQFRPVVHGVGGAPLLVGEPAAGPHGGGLAQRVLAGLRSHAVPLQRPEPARDELARQPV